MTAAVNLHGAIKQVRLRCCRTSLLFFAKHYLGQRFEKQWSAMHRELAEDLCPSFARGAKLVIAAPERYGVRSLVAYAYPLWALAFRRANFVVLGSRSRVAAGEMLRAIDSELRDNHLLLHDFPHLRRTTRTSGASGLRASPPRDLMIGRDQRVLTVGPRSSTGELTFKGTPPDLAVFYDADPLEPEDEMSYGVTAGGANRFMMKWRRGVLAGLESTSVVLAGPLKYGGGLIDVTLDEAKRAGWIARHYRAVQRYPEAWSRWFDWAKLRNGESGKSPNAASESAAETYFERHRKEMLAGAEVLWSSHESFTDLMDLRFRRGWARFDAEKQGRPPSRSLRYNGSPPERFVDDPFASSRITDVWTDDSGVQRSFTKVMNYLPAMSPDLIAHRQKLLERHQPVSCRFGPTHHPAF